MSAPSRLLHQVVAVDGRYEFLADLERRSETSFPEDELTELMRDAGIDDVNATLQDFTSIGVLQRYGERFGLSTFGIRTSLLLEALNGGDLREAYRRLSVYDSTLHTHELVREGMTEEFLQSVHTRPGFRRLYICSPWINLEPRLLRMLVSAVHREEEQGVAVELLVITRPTVGDGDRVPGGVQPLRDLGATVFLNPSLHTKLYIREPGSSGGYAMAIVGSQNLTRSQYLELGIRVNADSVLINQLIRYFFEVTNMSDEV